jgi:uncharacterized membrane protein (UPF0127 family)
MLFVFEQPQPLEFWMKDTLIPLDILFFDASGAYVSGATMNPCQADPCTIYPSAAAAQLALEIPSGTIAAQQIGPGWTLVR